MDGPREFGGVSLEDMKCLMYFRAQNNVMRERLKQTPCPNTFCQRGRVLQDESWLDCQICGGPKASNAWAALCKEKGWAL